MRTAKKQNLSARDVNGKRSQGACSFVSLAQLAAMSLFVPSLATFRLFNNTLLLPSATTHSKQIDDY